MGFLDVARGSFIDHIPKVLPGLELTDQLTLSGDGLVYIELRPELDYVRILGNLKPTRVVRGIFEGWSLPVFNEDDEELYFTICLPNRWDEASNILVDIDCYLDTANDGKKFGLQLTYSYYTPGTDAVPDTSSDVNVQTSTGTAPQYQSFKVKFTIPYSSMVRDDALALRVRRIDADPIGDEITGEVVITHVGVIFRRNKLGVEAP